MERLFREVSITRLAPITEQLILSFIAEKVLDLPKSYGPPTTCYNRGSRLQFGALNHRRRVAITESRIGMSAIAR